MADMAKVIYVETIEGVDYIRSWTTTNADTGAALAKYRPGPGKAFWFWSSIPAGQIIGVDMSGAPIAANNTAQNKALIDAITATPAEKLVFAE